MKNLTLFALALLALSILIILPDVQLAADRSPVLRVGHSPLPTPTIYYPDAYPWQIVECPHETTCLCVGPMAIEWCP